MAGQAPNKPVAPVPGLVHNEHSGDYLRLSRLWQRRTHFSLIFAAIDNPQYRDNLIARLNEGALGVHAGLTAGDSPQSLLDCLHAAAVGGASRIHVCIDIDWIMTPEWWQQANLLRERVADAFPGVLLLWLGDSSISTAAHHAPDLWNWREAVFTFAATVAHDAPTLAGAAFGHASAADKTEVQARLEQIIQYLATHGKTGGAAAHLQLEAARAYERLGQWDESETFARAAAELFSENNNASLAAQAKGLIASILEVRGRLDEALAIHQNETLPVYQQLGDVREAAITKSSIADILRVRGRLNEAVAIYQHEVLPVFQQLGDSRLVAITYGGIADILRGRGRLDEALSIHENDELPVFEQLGDVRSAAVTKGKIADILQARGEHAKALALWLDEVLPVFELTGHADEAAFAQRRVAALRKLMMVRKRK